VVDKGIVFHPDAICSKFNSIKAWLRCMCTRLCRYHYTHRNFSASTSTFISRPMLAFKER
jgi:hypothetical protein